MLYLDRSKRGVSVIIGYVILVSFVIVLAIIVYSWMKTYVPMEELNCPDGVSVFVEKYECSENNLTLYLKNNGRFNVGGYFIYATTSPTQLIATTDLSRNITESTAKIYPTGIKLVQPLAGNLFAPNQKETETYDLTGLNPIYSVEITPIRWQVEKNKNKLVSCKDARIRENIDCGRICVDDLIEISCLGKECGDIINNCGNQITCPSSCTETEVCDTTIGQCVLPEQCTDTCTGLLWECGTVCSNIPNNCGTCLNEHGTTVCSLGTCVPTCEEPYKSCDGITLNGCETNSDNDNLNCGTCGTVCLQGTSCVNGACTSCDGTWTGTLETLDVKCDGTPTPYKCFANNCTCGTGWDGNSTGQCNLDTTSVIDCGDYCDLFDGYITGYCQQNLNKCLPDKYIGFITGANITFAEEKCLLGGTNTPSCCCVAG